MTGLIGLSLPWIIIFAFINPLPLIWGVAGAVLINGLIFYFSFRVYKAEFDENFLYLTRRMTKRKIDLKDVIEVKTFPFPIYLFLSHAYITSLRYVDDAKQKKAFMITRGSYSWTPTIDSITEVTLFRQYILEKKYGR